MEFARLGQSGLQVSRLGIGTMTFGTQLDEGAAHRLLELASDAGINFFDSAELYPAPASPKTDGLSETILGRWMRGKSRDRIVVSTKVAGASDRAEGPRLPWVRGGCTTLDRFHFMTACEGSLRRLGTDYIDLYQPHWPDRITPIEVQFEAVDRLIEQGKVRYLGLSNETPWGLTKWCTLASNPRLRPAAVQNAYNLLQRRVEHGLTEACLRENVGFIAFSPLAMGVLTGKYTAGSSPSDARLSLFARYGEMYLQSTLLDFADAYVAVAEQHSLDPVRMSYAWTLQQPAVTCVLSSFSRVDQFAPFLESAQLRLEAEVSAKLDNVRQAHDARWNIFG